MDVKSKQLQLQYQGYLETPILWKNKPILGIEQINLPNKEVTPFDKNIEVNLRLGKLVECFVFSLLEEHSDIELLVENIQIQDKKITIGEIDAILKRNRIPIHLEIVYKFYLYDPSIGNSELEHWIGPNRNDNLVKKLYKLKDKQLPLIRNIHAKPLLDNLNINVDYVIQQVHFKAQLFEPYHNPTTNFELLNENCLIGFYIHYSEISQFSDCKFYVPSKKNWLQNVRSNVKWLKYEEFEDWLLIEIEDKRSPLAWFKYPNGVVKKFFVVWWDVTK